MLRLIFRKAFEEYRANFKVMLSFGILFVFLLLFIYFDQFFLSTGTVHLAFTDSTFSILGMIFSLIFLYVFAFFVSLTVYSVKRDVQHMSFDSYWSVMLQKAAVKIFIYYFLVSVFVYLVFLAGLYTGMLALSAVVSFIVFALLMYVPQSAVLDEKSLAESFEESIGFFFKNIGTSLGIIIFGSIALFIILLIEYALELVAFPGIIISFILVLIVLVPFMEQMKAYAFVLKFDLIKQPEVLASTQRPRIILPKVQGVRLREKKHGGKL